MIVEAPAADGEYATEQLECAVVPSGDRLQVVESKLPAPVCEKVTVPVGADLVPLSLSVTVTVQDELSLIGTDAGEHVTFVVVDRFVTESVSLTELFVLFESVVPDGAAMVAVLVTLPLVAVTVAVTVIS